MGQLVQCCIMNNDCLYLSLFGTQKFESYFFFNRPVNNAMTTVRNLDQTKTNTLYKSRFPYRPPSSRDCQKNFDLLTCFINLKYTYQTRRNMSSLPSWKTFRKVKKIDTSIFKIFWSIFEWSLWWCAYLEYKKFN